MLVVKYISIAITQLQSASTVESIRWAVSPFASYSLRVSSDSWEDVTLLKSRGLEIIKSTFVSVWYEAVIMELFFFKPSDFIILRQEKLTSLKQNNQTHPKKQLKLSFYFILFLHQPKAAEVTQ